MVMVRHSEVYCLCKPNMGCDLEHIGTTSKDGLLLVCFMCNIYQSCVFVAKCINQLYSQFLHFYQNSTVPSLEQLCQALSEREQQSSVKLSRVNTGPVIESTSVAPRQRPKASQNPTGQLPIGGLPINTRQ